MFSDSLLSRSCAAVCCYAKCCFFSCALNLKSSYFWLLLASKLCYSLKLSRFGNTQLFLLSCSCQRHFFFSLCHDHECPYPGPSIFYWKRATAPPWHCPPPSSSPPWPLRFSPRAPCGSPPNPPALAFSSLPLHPVCVCLVEVSICQGTHLICNKLAPNICISSVGPPVSHALPVGRARTARGLRGHGTRRLGSSPLESARQVRSRCARGGDAFLFDTRLLPVVGGVQVVPASSGTSYRSNASPAAAPRSQPLRSLLS